MKELVDANDLLKKWDQLSVFKKMQFDKIIMDTPIVYHDEDTKKGYSTRDKLLDLAVREVLLEEYREIGSTWDCRCAVGKQKAQKPISDERFCVCPVCGNVILGGNRLFEKFCSNCGQKIDWSEYPELFINRNDVEVSMTVLEPTE